MARNVPTASIPELITNAYVKVFPDHIKSLFQKVLQDLLHVLNDLRWVLNGDETSFLLNPKSKVVLALRGSQNVYDIEINSSKLNVTVMFTFHVPGETVSRTIIYPYISIPQEVAKSVPSLWDIARLDSWWMTSVVFPDYTRNILIQVKKPVIFIIDGHGSHIFLETSKMWQRFCNPQMYRHSNPWRTVDQNQ